MQATWGVIRSLPLPILVLRLIKNTLEKAKKVHAENDALNERLEISERLLKEARAEREEKVKKVHAENDALNERLEISERLLREARVERDALEQSLLQCQHDKHKLTDIVVKLTAEVGGLVFPRWEILDYSEPDEWKPFPEDKQAEIEQAYQAHVDSDPQHRNGIYKFTRRGHGYWIDWVRMIQKNHTTKKARPIRRMLAVPPEHALEAAAAQLRTFRTQADQMRQKWTTKCVQYAQVKWRKQVLQHRLEHETQAARSALTRLNDKLTCQRMLKNAELHGLQYVLNLDHELSHKAQREIARLTNQLACLWIRRGAELHGLQQASYSEVASITNKCDCLKVEKELAEAERGFWKEESESQFSQLKQLQGAHNSTVTFSAELVLSMIPVYSPTQYGKHWSERLGLEDPRHEYLANAFCSSFRQHRVNYRSSELCDRAQLIIDHIDMLHNPGLTNSYLAQRTSTCTQSGNFTPAEHVISALHCRREDVEDVDCNEYLLFHGAPEAVLDSIARTGFDPRRGGEAVGALFGVGSYFAENGSKSDLYSKPTASNLRSQLVARVILGNIFWTKTALKGAQHPPYVSGQMPDTVAALARKEEGCVDFREYIVYNNSQALPVARIYYRHAELCRCHICRGGV